MTISPALKKKLLPVAVIAIAAVAGWWAWSYYTQEDLSAGFVSGNGRLEATEVDVAARLPGRVVDVLVREGEFVKAGQPVARMQLESLEAQRAEAQAGRDQALHSATADEAQVVLRESDVAAAQALVAQREAELDAAKRRLARSKTLSIEGAASIQELDDDQARTRGAEAALAATRAQVTAAQAAVSAAKAQVVGARASVQAAEATIDRIEADIRDSELKSPRDGRVQFLVAQPGEVLAAGGRVLNLLDVSDVYMTFFVPETVAGRVALGSEVRMVLDAAPGVVIPASVSFVASQAQFTPKTVETASERQKLMFRVRAKIAPELLREHLEQVKTGVPGEAWIKLDPEAQWPASLTLNVGR
ncbi:HlyD family efflux transporter periplasmic adaptor subunit [Pseudomonas hefeiensis]|uniref:HlyD family efflux transporter periplasmic adaptor subunit n=1 Tax=Pseudomonas hefeiensis TaxID=2738125 RepID=A0ABY9GGQ9_9PSED|nr:MULTISPECIES: HlyD family efflux transporter periplasmic adaptor subunit [unclassified Pseudomonas]WLH14854.1 HlyD family efflux transporter periplasmic adaptor subunit [Pseudomonas sp. FP205]WLH97905.1 HlyD family efflux transporter periplasmic adaptor subunit [Pseudomonas sp. FP53]WLI42180.1 HlyD family efflux transporter periplasmic adaptor subunit [Pseudomonas sp. FP821]